MGGGIAMACANAGLAVRIMDATPAALATGLDHVRRNYETSVTRGRFSAAQVEERLARVTGQLDYAGFDEADVIIEAVFESLDLKRRIFAELDQVARPGAVLGTNTSTLDIDAIAAATSRPADVIGLHFFSPANVMRLLEIVRGRQTAPGTIATAFALAKRLGKVGVLAGNCPGFIGNRMMFPYMYETQFMVEEGATPDQVDRALTGFGMAMGMFAVDDMAGIDVAWRVRQELKHFTAPGERRPLVADRLYEMGRLGQKTGRGWYRYDAARKAEPDQEVVDLIRAEAARAGVAAADVHRRRDRRAIGVRAHQRRRPRARRRLRPARLRHRRHLRQRLRLSGLARRTDVLRRSRRPDPRAQPDPAVRGAAWRPVGASAAAHPAGGDGRNLPRARSVARLVASMDLRAAAVRPARILAPDVTLDQRPDGTVYARSPHQLGAYPPRITDRLDDWAERAGERPFLAERDRRRTLADASASLPRARRCDRSRRRSSTRRLDPERPIAILSGNSIEHGLIALAAMTIGQPYAPIAPSVLAVRRTNT